MPIGKRSKSLFGQLLQKLRDKRKLSQLALERLLWNKDYPITNGQINKYEFGLRSPPPRLITALAQSMELSEDEKLSLVQAVLTDHNSSYLNELEPELRERFKLIIQEQAFDKGESASSGEPLKQPKDRRPLKVFLCHSSNDKTPVRKLYKRLLKEGFDPWLDEQDLIPGQNWDYEIQLAVQDTDVVIVLLSRSSITKAGYVQKEIKYALDVADNQPEGAIFIIPARLEECEVPSRLKGVQWVDLHNKNGYPRLKSALEKRAKDLESKKTS